MPWARSACDAAGAWRPAARHAARGPTRPSRASSGPVEGYDFGPLACGGCGFLGLCLPPALLAFRSPQAMMVPAARPFVSVATCTLTEYLLPGSALNAVDLAFVLALPDSLAISVPLPP